MARITVEDCLDKVTSRFALVMLVAKRAKQLMKGANPTVPFGENKEIVHALREVAANQVYYDSQVQAEMISELEKDLSRVASNSGGVIDVGGAD